jgi:hypothetical protein
MFLLTLASSHPFQESKRVNLKEHRTIDFHPFSLDGFSKEFKALLSFGESFYKFFDLARSKAICSLTNHLGFHSQTMF